MNSKCGVQSKRMCESHESCVCTVGFPACACERKSVVYETECRHAAVQRGKCSFQGEVLSGGDGVPREQVLQQSSEFSGEVG